jgi:hypothetical protein
VESAIILNLKEKKLQNKIKMVSIKSIFDIDVCDPFESIMEYMQIEQEKSSCTTKEDQINFMYRYHSANAITINELAKDYDILYSAIKRLNLNN